MFLVHSSQQGFIHQARTGGAFIESQCQQLTGFESLRPRHQTAPTQYQHYRWAAVLRHPVDRFVSLWQHWIRLPQYSTEITLQPNSICDRTIMESWDNFCAWHHDHPTQEQQFGAWCSQAGRINAATQLFRFPHGLAAAVAWFGATVTGVAINQSVEDLPPVTALQRSQIEQHYAADMTLWESSR
jgi:hypothetical protein